VVVNSFYQDGRRLELDYYANLDEEAFLNSVDSYTKATSSDPDFALAYWRLGNLYEAHFNSPGEKDPADLERMASYYEKAYEVDRYSAEANVGMGWYFFYQYDYDRAAQYLKLGYELDRNNAELNFLIGSFLKSIGLFENALIHYERGLELDPLPQDFSIWYELRSECCRSLGRYADAVRFLEKAVQQEPSPALFLEMATCLICLKQFRDAEIQIQEAEKHNDDIPAVGNNIRRQQALLYAALGEQELALDLIRDEQQLFRPVFTSIYGLLGLKVHAIPKIEEGIQVGMEEVGETLYSYPVLMNNPCYDSLRGDPRFQEILRMEGEKYKNLLAKYGDL
jgi:tetratricopeptide (TPR) repeat protein